MLISLNWLKDFVELPAGLDPRELAGRLTLTTAEVDGVEQRSADFRGLVAARIESVERLPGDAQLQLVTLLADRRHTTVSTAPDLLAGRSLVYAPPGAVLGGRSVATMTPQPTGGGKGPATVQRSEGTIVAWGALGFPEIGAQAVFLPPAARPGEPVDAKWFDDWIIEIDNKSITHRPDCWGHYGIAREVAAMLGAALRPYEVVPEAQLRNRLPSVSIEIDDPALCPRYSALLMKGLKAQPSPLWMQARLALVGLRPIDLPVDLTNYIMAELGQPMHAFDAALLGNIQVALAAPGETFTTLDGVKRALPPRTLMIQSNRKSVAIAGVMGGAETQVTARTDTVLLESANFDAATIRRAAAALGLRTEASSRFEKSLDPAHTVLAIARFVHLARAELPGLELASTLSDAYPRPRKIEPILLDIDFTSRMLGKPVGRDEVVRILERLEFKCEEVPAGRAAALRVTPPSFRATKDIEIEADLIEEVARFVGYNNIEPALPRISARHFGEMPGLVIEERTLDYFCRHGDFSEVHSYIWYDDAWLGTIGFEPGDCLTLKNPAAEGCSRLRRTLVPGLLATAERNRLHFRGFNLAEIGSVFESGRETVESSQTRHLGLLVAESGKKQEIEGWNRLRRALDGWGWQVLGQDLRCAESRPVYPWEDAGRLAEVLIGGKPVGRITIVPLALRQRIDERLRAWSFAVAELNLAAVEACLDRHEKLPAVPRFPQVELDFSVLVDADRRYREAAAPLDRFEHPLLRRLWFVESYEGGSVPDGKRSLLLRAQIGAEDRTLDVGDVQAFREAFVSFVQANGMRLRG